MNILIAFHELNNPGGIINHHEALCAGFIELGHKVTVRYLTWKESVIAREESNRKLEQEKGFGSVLYDQDRGWHWPPALRFAYRGTENLKLWKKFSSKFDLIIWQVPVPTMQRENRGNTDWVELYNVPVKQIAHIHDGNMISEYPWICAVANKLVGLTSSHVCAYNSCNRLPIPRALTLSPQMNIEQRMRQADNSTKRNGWFSLQTFKAWKHVGDVVRAVPYMGKYAKVLAGGGIEYYYMNDKGDLSKMTKSHRASVLRYIASSETDPDAPKAVLGKSVWELAIQAGMRYVGYITNKDRAKWIHGAKYLIDSSWNIKYASIGDHFNRVSVDGIIDGAVPIARNLGVATNREGVGEFFKPGRNYIMVPHDTTPKQFAEAVNEAISLPESKRLQILEEARKMLVYFDNRRVAQAFIDIAKGKPAGYYKTRDAGKLVDPEMSAVGQSVMRKFFGNQQRKTLF